MAQVFLTVAAARRILWQRVDNFHKRQPLFCACCWASGKGVLGSVIADRVIYELAMRKERKREDKTKDESPPFVVDQSKMVAFGILVLATHPGPLVER